MKLVRFLMKLSHETVTIEIKNTTLVKANLWREYHTTVPLAVGQDWRKSKGLPCNPNACGPLTDGPDYSFIDGKPTPPGTGKIKRAIKQLDYSTKIMKLSQEVDFAVEYRKQRDEEEERRKQNILQRKLIPKGRDL